MRAQRERETRTRRVHYRKQGSVDAGKRTRRSKSGRPTREEIERRGRSSGGGAKEGKSTLQQKRERVENGKSVGGDRRRRQGSEGGSSEEIAGEDKESVGAKLGRRR